MPNCVQDTSFDCSGATKLDQMSVARCRYKTGRCINARVVKPNGTLLLLCEFHRRQQNRTKKRSDMKYRHYRAKKRLAQRQKMPLEVQVTSRDDTIDTTSSNSRGESNTEQQYRIRVAEKQDSVTPWRKNFSTQFYCFLDPFQSASLECSPSTVADARMSNSDLSLHCHIPYITSPTTPSHQQWQSSWEPDDVQLLEYFIL